MKVKVTLKRKSGYELEEAPEFKTWVEEHAMEDIHDIYGEILANSYPDGFYDYKKMTDYYLHSVEQI